MCFTTSTFVNLSLTILKLFQQKKEKKEKKKVVIKEEFM